MSTVKIGDVCILLDVEEKLRPSVERCLTGTTKMDAEIENLPIVSEPAFTRLIINLIRLYQKNISPILGNRCVFEPSCSHFCELSIRNYGFTKGIFLTLKRLYRCRPGSGGVDLPEGESKCNIKLNQ